VEFPFFGAGVFGGELALFRVPDDVDDALKATASGAKSGSFLNFSMAPIFSSARTRS